MTASKTKRTTTTTTTTRTTTNNNNENWLQPLLVGIVMMLVTMAFRHYMQDASSSKQPANNMNDWFLSSHAIKPTVTMDPMEAVEMEMQHIQQHGDSGTRIFNSFISNKEVLEQLASPQLWQDCNDHGTRWFHVGVEPQDIWQETALLIWNPLVETQTAVGFEYWCNILDPSTGLDWHVDKDEVLYSSSEELKTPIMGAVYYGFPHAIQGGYLETIQGDATQEEFDGGRESIRPEYNRLVILNVSQWHRVSEIAFGERYTLAVNIWDHKPIGL